MVRIIAHSLVGVADQQCWSQAQQLQNAAQSVGLVLSLQKTIDQEILDLASIGGVVFERFHERGQSITSSNQWYEWVQKELIELKEAGLEVSILIAICYQQRLWMWGQGSTMALLCRKGEFARLVGEKGFEHGIEGEMMSGDIFALGTKSATNYFLEPETRKKVANGDNLVEDLAPQFYTQEKSADQALILFEVEDQVEESASETKRFVMPKITIKRMGEEPRRFNLKVGGVIAIILMILVCVGIWRRSYKLATEKYTNTLGRALTMLTEAQTVADTNPERAKILLNQSKEVLTSYIQTNPKAEYNRRAKEQLSVIEGKAGEILKVRGIVLNPTIELGLIADGLQAQTMQGDGLGTLNFWDESKRAFVGTHVDDLSKITLEVQNERFVTPFSVDAGVYTGISESGVWRGSKKEQKIVIPTDETWGKITQVATFGNNIYLLDTGIGEVWKYAATDTGYAERKRWLGAGIILDLSKVVDWVVDGDVWLLTSSGKLEKYSRGVPGAFNMIGFPSESQNGGFLDPAAVTIVENTIYVLEKGVGRVVAIKTDGTYKQQYVSDDFKRASDIAVYQGKGYVLVDNVIKEWEL